MRSNLLIAAACLVALFSTVGASLPYPILAPLFAADAANDLNHFMGLPPKLLFGIALTINPIGLLLGSTLLGPLSDRFGRRTILLSTSLGAALGHAITAASLVNQSYPLFIVARFATGLMEGNGSVARALLADQLEGSMRVKAFSIFNGALYMGWLAGPLLAGLTLGWGITSPFWVAVVALLVTSAIAWFAIPSNTWVGTGPGWWQVVKHQHALTLLKHADLRTLLVIQMAYTCGVTAFYEFNPLWLVEVCKFDAQGIAWASAGLCAVMTLTSIYAGRVLRSNPLQQAGGFAIATALCIAVVAAGGPTLGLAAIVIFGIPNACYNAIMPAWCAERFGHLGQGAVMGLWSTIFCLSNILMALVGSVLALIDTRLILLLGALLTGWAAWRILRWAHNVRPAMTGTEIHP
jgi:MFS family permease